MVKRRGTIMNTSKVRRGVYQISFHGQSYLLVKHHYWYPYRLDFGYNVTQSQRFDRPYWAEFPIFEDGHWFGEKRYASLREFQNWLKRTYAERALAAMSQ